MSTNLDEDLQIKPKYLVSIVVPIFNMEGRLSNLFNWIVEANELGFQVVLICNCCTDGTRLELENFCHARNLKNVSIFECNIPGPGNARNFGKNLVLGEFVLFWDSDDIGYPKVVEDILSESRNFDLLLASHLTETSKRHSYQSMSTAEAVKLDEFSLNPGIWRCIFRADAIQYIRFGESRMGEDQVFLARLLSTNPDIAFSSGIIYQYQRNVSNQLTSIRENIAGLISSVNFTKKLINSTPIKFKPVTTTFTLRMILTGIKRGSFSVKIEMFFLLIKLLFLMKLESVSRRKRIDLLTRVIRDRKNA